MRSRVAKFTALLVAALALAAAGNLVRCADVGVCVFPHVDSWKLHQFVFTYEAGFWRRALVGSALALDPATGPHDWPVRVFSTVVFVAFAALLVALSLRAPRPLRWAMAASPAVFLQAGFDLGRLDQLNHLILLAALASGWRPAVLVAPAMVLAHEAAALIHLPLFFAIHRAVHGPSRVAAVAMAISAGVLAALIAFGGHDPGPEIRGRLPEISPEAWEMLARTIPEHVRFVGVIVGTFSAEYVGRLAILLAYLGLVALLARSATAPVRAFGAPIMVFAFAPLLLAAVGFDWPRWVALAALNLFVLAMFLPAAEARPRRALVVLAIAAALMGPMGDAAPTPLFGRS